MYWIKIKQKQIKLTIILVVDVASVVCGHNGSDPDYNYTGEYVDAKTAPSIC